MSTEQLRRLTPKLRTRVLRGRTPASQLHARQRVSISVLSLAAVRSFTAPLGTSAETEFTYPSSSLWEAGV
jgi:hypothetical protein